ncbi:TPA: amino acid adenylation domain-containing protein [Staphylococcus aureus]|nr:amino acid adenylation domain-containing protein [Staphylococcus aureus]HDP5847007.1 amino acid adenylation domain-containing protein [Staphylococcus aureus]HDP5929156.1 amino acid adenylation domain-containing protein [Staphylococcus aureus]
MTDVTLHGLFEQQAQKTPYKTALIFNKQSITYEDLNNKSNDLANILIRENTGNNIGILMDTSIEYVISILAILKAGKTYIPLSNKLPTNRLQYIIDDANIEMIIINSSLYYYQSNLKIPYYLYESQKNKYTEKNSPSLSLDNNAYIIYTSGTTGKPKGVPIKHKAICNTLVWRKKFHNLNENNVNLLSFSFLFDGSILSLFSFLISGGSVVLIQDDQKGNLNFIKQVILNENVTHLFMIPSLLINLLEICSVEDFKNIELISLGGEKFPKSVTINEIVTKNQIKLSNEYGPTEGAVVATCLNNVNKSNYHSIGFPINNMTVKVLSNDLEEVEIGQIGELCIEGLGLTEGYLNNQEKNNESFILLDQKKYYRTGDLVRRNKDGSVDYISRKDYQVKVRGYRIELEEIESVIGTHPQIINCSVVVKNINGENQLVAYYVKKEEEMDFHYNLISYLEEMLPEYMVPTSCIEIEEIPYTSNGKVDKSILSNMIIKSNQTKFELESKLQEVIHNIWSKYLGHKEFSIYDDFFKLGGHSLMIAKIIRDLNEYTDIKLNFNDVYQHPSIKQLEEYINMMKEKGDFKDTESIHELEVSPTQKPIYYYMQKNPDSLAYNIPFYIKLNNNISLKQLEISYNNILKRNAILRTNYKWNGNDIQLILNDYIKQEISVQNIDDIDNVLKTEVKKFGLDTDFLIRLKILKTKNSQYLFVDVHHIIFDGFSLEIFIKELFEDIDFKEENNVLVNEILPSYIINKRSDEYYNFLDAEYKTEFPEPISLVISSNNIPTTQKYESFELKKIIKEIQRKLEINATTNNIMLSIFIIMIYKYTHQNNIVLGIPFSNRRHNKNIGMHVNTLPLKYKLNKELSFVKILEDIQNKMLMYINYEDTDIEDIIEILSDKSSGDLFNIIFSTQVNSEIETSEDFKLLNVTEPKSQFVFTLYDREDGYSLQIDTFLKDESDKFIDDFINHFYTVAKYINEDINIKSQEIDILTENEINKKINYPVIGSYEHTTINKAFENIVSKYPKNIAITSQGYSITYEKLNSRANQIAHYLKGIGVKENDYIGLYMNRDILFVETMLAILKLGAIYVPIDKNYPIERKKHIIINSKLNFILSDINNNLNFKGKFININDINLSENIENLNLNSDINSAAYVIYTSGSTGKPKGVEVTHSNVLSLLYPDENNFIFNENDCWTAFHSFCFDFSVWEIYGAILYGGKLIIVSDEIAKDTSKFSELLINEKVSVLNQTPSSFYSLIDYSNEHHLLYPNLRYVIFGGEALNPKKLYNWSKCNQHVSLINMYGITETTVHVTYKKLSIKDLEISTSNIGKPLSTLKHYIFDQDFKMVPINHIGELYIAGHGVSNGYLNQPNLTKERFIKNPYNLSEILYKTGDLVLENYAGELEYIGRTDSQVKIRGYRIEIGEVERNINNISGVDNCKVIVEENEKTGKYLMCFVKTELDISELRMKVSEVLTHYMRPSEYIKTSSWPTTTNGKVDTNKLREYSINDSKNTEHIVKTNTQKVLYKIWEEQLNKSKFSINDNFFDIGGHSLMVAKMIRQINSHFNSELSFTNFYQNPTILKLSSLLDINNLNISTEHKYENVIEFNMYEKTKPVTAFFIHGGNGRVDTYNEFVKNISFDINLIGIELYKNNNISREYIKCEELAEKYIEQIKKYQKNGPYYLFGTCIGGTIAYEIALQLEKIHSEKVYLFLASVEAPTAFENNISYEESVNNYIENIRENIGYTKYNIYNTSIWYQLIDYCKETNKSIEIVADKIKHSLKNMNSNSYFELFYRKNLTEDLVFMRDNYQPAEILNSDVIYFEAISQPLNTSKDWNLYCNNISYFKVSGDHDSIFQSSNAKLFVECFEEILSEILEKSKGN